MITFGGTGVSNIMFGDAQVNSIYLGSTLVWSHSTTPSTPSTPSAVTSSVPVAGDVALYDSNGES